MQTSLKEKYNLTHVSSPKPYTLSKIRDYDKSLEKVWHVEYYIYSEEKQQKVRRRVTLNQPTAKMRYAEAKKLAKEIDAMLTSGAVLGTEEQEPISLFEINLTAISEKSTVIEACSAYLGHIKKVLAVRTRETYETDIKRFTTYLTLQKPKITLLSFENHDAIAFLDSLAGTISNRSINNNKNTLKTLFNFFIKRHKKKLTENPFADIDKLPDVARKHKAFLPAEKAAFIKKANELQEHQLLLFCEFIYYTFMRPGYELRLLKVEHILPNRTIRVECETSKGKTTEFTGIPKKFYNKLLKSKILSYPPDYYVFTRYGMPGKQNADRDFFYKKHVEILKAIGLDKKHIDLYSWKHTGAITLYEKTKNIFLIQKQCRHKDLDSTLKYIRDLGLFVDLEELDDFPDF